MSGVEFVGLGLAVLPILIEVVKSYSAVAEKFRTFRTYSKQVKDIHGAFFVQKKLFENECRLLLLTVVSEEQTRDEMVSNPRHRLWRDTALERKLHRVLGTQLDLCVTIVEDFADKLRDFDDELQCFDCLLEKKLPNSSVKDTIRKFGKSVKIAFDKPKFEELLRALRERTADLTQLRSQISDFSTRTGKKSTALRNIIPQYDSVQRAAQKLQEALNSASWCGNHGHASHIAKLRIDAEISESVVLDLAIACQSSCGNYTAAGSMPSRPIWLYVQNETFEQSPRRVGSDKSIPCIPGKPASRTTAPGSGVQTTSSDNDFDTPPKKRRKVKFQFTAESQTSSSTCPQLASVSIETTDLRLAQDICRLFRRGCNMVPACLGYLESDYLRHSFYLAEHDAKRQRYCKITSEVHNVPELLTNQSEEAVSVVDQLRLARKATTAVLQYNGTPWLRREWSLGDLALFGTSDGLTEEKLDTLHLSTLISHTADASGVMQIDGAAAGASAAVNTTDAETDLETMYGIDNIVLFCLGVALLQIGFWQPMEKLKRVGDLNEVLAARRLLKRQTPLGPKYQRIVQRCLRCDFGSGNDLGSDSLQNAVHTNIVTELDSMIAALSVTDD